MYKLKPELLETAEFQEEDFNAALKGTRARGTYSPMKFVIRLRDDIHNLLNNDEDTNSFEKIQAFSTFMHENIHWWQHVGANFGFISSLSYPAIAHLAHNDLQTLVKRNEKYKSIVKYDEFYFSKYQKFDNGEVNGILNTWHDIYYAKLFVLDNKSIDKILEDNRFFTSIGHCYKILWKTTIECLASTIDPTYKFLPNFDDWLEEFKELESKKVEGFYIDSNMHRPPIGTHAIFEGQARFNQLQYLAIASKNQLKYVDFEQIGQLKGIYVEAFELFLKITTISKPLDLNNSTIGLFLLVCDIAINPTDGFPMDISCFENFIVANDPGLRFCMLCLVISQDKSKWIDVIKEYSANEYINVSKELCSTIFPSPYEGCITINNWIKEQGEIKKLLEEEKNMKYDLNNIAVRLYFSKYLRFQEDKLKYPNIFCWIGKSMTHEVSTEITLDLVEKIFNKHKALYIDDIDGEIHAMIFDDYTEDNLQETFNAFYTMNVTYDMIIKWIQEEGKFTYNYSWLTQKDKEEVKTWVRNNFYKLFKIYPEDLEML